MPGKSWKCLDRKKVYEARDDKTIYMELYRDRVIAPDGREVSYTFYKSSDIVIVVPFLDRERLVMIRQYRYPLGKVMLEFPAGHIEKGESPLATARRELEEETGYRAKNVKHVYSYHPSVSKSRQIVHVFSAAGLVPGKTRHDSTEEIDVEILGVASLEKMIRRQQVENAGTLVAYLLCCTGIMISGKGSR
jgi:ADP-ribose pyrophosphatase